MNDECRPVRVLLVDDHALFRNGVRALLSRHTEVEVVGDAGDALEGVKRAAELRPDVVLLDLRMPEHSGIEVLRELRKRRLAMPIAMLTTSRDEKDVIDSLQNRAQGYLLKDMEPEQLLDRVRASLAGETVIGPALAARLAGALRQEAQDSAGGAKRDLGLLTDREQQVLRCLADGQSNKRIARSLSITEGTVKVHVKNLLKKLSFRSRVEAAVWMAQQPH